MEQWSTFMGIVERMRKFQLGHELRLVFVKRSYLVSIIIEESSDSARPLASRPRCVSILIYGLPLSSALVKFNSEQLDVE